MDISGLTSITTSAQMLTWLAENCMTPINPGMSGSDFGAIMQKIISVGSSDQQIITYLQSLPGYVGDGSKTLGDDLIWQGSGETALASPVLTSGEITSFTIALNWDAVDNTPSYILQRAKDSAFTVSLTNIYSGPDISFSDTGLTISTPYFYRIKATATGFSDSPWSAGQSSSTNGKTANLVVGEDFDPIVDGWNTIPDSSLGTAVPLSDALGASLGWTVTPATSDSVTFETIDSQLVSYFPLIIAAQQWYGDPAGILSFNISGLDTSKTYTIKTCHADSGFVGNGHTDVNCNGSAVQSGDPDNLTYVLEFDDISPDSEGNILVSMTSTDGTPVINALIVVEQ